MAADLTKSIVHLTENLFLGGDVDNVLGSGTAVAGFDQKNVAGIYVASATVDLASAAANTATLQEFTITDTTYNKQIAVGDLFIPIAWSGLDAGLTLPPAAAVTAHKLPLKVVNSTVGAINAGPATVTFIWVDLA